MHIIIEKFGVSKIFYVFERSLFMVTKPAFIWSKIE